MIRAPAGSPLNAFLIALSLRVVYSVFAAIAAPHLTVDPGLVKSNYLSESAMAPDSSVRYRALGVWERFDTLWYLRIAGSGYDRKESVVFYPLYPLLIRTVSAVIRQPTASALLVATLGSFFLYWGFARLMLLDIARPQVSRSLFALAIWPASFIFYAGYAESLLSALIIWSVYFARCERWWAAGIGGFLAGLTKAAGILSFVPLAIIAWRKKSVRSAPVFLSLCGPAVFHSWLMALGQPAPVEVYLREWDTTRGLPWMTLFASISEVASTRNLLLTLNLIALSTVAVLVCLKSIRLEYLLYSGCAVCLFLTKRTDPLLQSTMRYVVIIFPVFASLAGIVRDRAVFTVVCLLLAVVNVYLLLMFIRWSLVV